MPLHTDRELAKLVGKWCRIEGPASVKHDFTFMRVAVEITVSLGEHRLSLWEAYLASVHTEIKITCLEI